mmetsp:Transcript_5032/g.15804  ORF Transcript_5032/g.15804 Transcript_5032/m.15804 type:complete len:321 (-) Transcript_5032:370-1332(-)
MEGKSSELDDVSWPVLEAQNASTTAALIERLSGEPWFEAFARAEGEAILARDAEDAEKLEAGIAQSVARGVLRKRAFEPQYTEIDVLGKTPDQVCDVILAKVPVERGAVVVLCGLSGTGKGTTVATLQRRLAKAARWSNGDCFRALTWLACTWCEQHGVTDVAEALTPENVATFVRMLSFEKTREGSWDLRVHGLGISARVSQVANTALKAPRISRNVPTVSHKAQGEVVLFANEAVAKLKNAGRVVLLEGRRATVNYIDSPFRFVLTISDTDLLGKRRAAQRLAAALLDHFRDKRPPPSERDILRKALDLAKAMTTTPD